MKEPVTFSACPNCRSVDIRFSLACKDYVVTREDFDLWECSSCDFKFTNPCPSPAEIGRYYDSAFYMSHATGGKGVFNQAYQLARRYAVWWRCNLVSKFAAVKSGNLLDLGAGVGAFANAMKLKHWNVVALEPDKEARQAAFEKLQLQMESMEHLKKLPNDHYHVITLWHVLEHVHDYHYYLQEIYRLLKKDGILVIAVPNFKSKDARHYGKYWDGWDVPRHLYHFSPSSLGRLAAEKGFQLQTTRQFWLDAYYACLLSEQHKTRRKNWLSAILQGTMSNFSALTNINNSSAITYLFTKR